MLICKLTIHGSRNPCCSGPTPSTAHDHTMYRLIGAPVAIPVVVDLLLRPHRIRRSTNRTLTVAIPVVVDLLLRQLRFKKSPGKFNLSQSLL